MITSLEGVPVIYDLVRANTASAALRSSVLARITNATIIGDKGFLGVEWQEQVQQQTGNTVITPKRKNQKIRHPDGFRRLLNSVRERIEGAFHELQNPCISYLLTPLDRWIMR